MTVKKTYCVTHHKWISFLAFDITWISDVSQNSYRDRRSGYFQVGRGIYLCDGQSECNQYSKWTADMNWRLVVECENGPISYLHHPQILYRFRDHSTEACWESYSAKATSISSLNNHFNVSRSFASILNNFSCILHNADSMTGKRKLLAGDEIHEWFFGRFERHKQNHVDFRPLWYQYVAVP